MINNKNSFYIFLSGVILLCVCIIGTCISSISKYNDLNIIQYRVLLVPYILSYVFISIGLLGLSGILNLFNKIK